LIAENNEENVVLKNDISTFTTTKGVILYEKLREPEVKITLKLERNERDSRNGGM